MNERIYKTTSGDVHYWVSKQPNPTQRWLLFVPGLTADHSLFAPQIEYFKNRANVIAWDAPAHAASRPYPLDLSLDDYAHILHDIATAENATRPVLVGQSLGGYVGQAYLHLFPGEIAGFVSIDSAPLQRQYYQTWELTALEHTYRMYLSIPWKLLIAWGSRGVAETEAGRANMREMMSKYGKIEFCKLAAHGFHMLAQAVKEDCSFNIDCPALLMCGEKDAAGSANRYNTMWHERSKLPLEWIPNAGHNCTLDAPDYVNACIEAFMVALPSEPNRQ